MSGPQGSSLESPRLFRQRRSCTAGRPKAYILRGACAALLGVGSLLMGSAVARAEEQPDFRLQVLDATADGALRAVQLGGGRRKAQVPRRDCEDLQGIERR